jgi:FixJ family two-component response regulator
MTTLGAHFVALVDDDASLSDALADPSNWTGLSTETYQSFEEFLLWASLDRVRCLILDRGRRGRGVRKLRQHRRAKGWRTPLVCTNGQPGADERLTKKVLRAGARTILYKPFDPEGLLNQDQSNGNHAKSGPAIVPRAGGARKKSRT